MVGGGVSGLKAALELCAVGAKVCDECQATSGTMRSTCEHLLHWSG